MPSIFRLSDSSYTAATGQQPDRYLANWLLVTAALFVLSAVAYATQLRRASLRVTDPTANRRSLTTH